MPAPPRTAHHRPNASLRPNLDRSQIRPGDRICAAVSGGADSVALLRALQLANSEQRDALGVGLSAIHVHHGIRGDEADADQAFVAALCSGLGIPLHLVAADVPEAAARDGETLEEAARNARYRAFYALIESGEADAVLTAHTMDDQAETVLHKLLRGAWTEGLGGIFPVLEVSTPSGRRGRILRPLLECRRADLVSFLQQLDQPWREDSSNTDPAFTRNRLRHQVLPLLRAENPSLDQTLANLAELAREDEARWQSELGRILPQLLLPGKPTRGGGRAVSTAPESRSLAIEVERLRALEPALRRRVLRSAARQLGVRLSFPETSRLLALCGLRTIPTVSSKPGSTLRLAGDLVAERSARELRLAVSSAPSPPKSESATMPR